jgi:hypothetical protein
MNQAISPGLVPPPTGLEREEPEIADELDIPSEDLHEKGDVLTPEPGKSEHPAA